MKFYDLHLQSNLSDGENSIEEIVKFAEKLGYTGLYFLYNFNDYLNNRKEFDKNNKIKIYTGILVDSRNINKINKLKNKEVRLILNIV